MRSETVSTHTKPVRPEPPAPAAEVPAGAFPPGQERDHDTRPSAPPRDQSPPPAPEADSRSAARPAPPTHPGTSSTVWVRRRLARLGAQRGTTMNPVLEPLVKTVRATHPKADIRLIERAYDVAAHYHRSQKRKSGDPYITHPLAVATILAELGMHEPPRAGLLHDTVEDTEYTLDQLRSDFGDEIAELVDGVTKLDKVKYGEAAQAETVRKMVVAMARDIRVLVIKLCRPAAQHAHAALPAAGQAGAARPRETLEIYAPLAHRLGMNTIKWELEDLAFATLYPKRYDEIARLVAERAPPARRLPAGGHRAVYADLRDAKIKATVTGRPKHYYSIYQKMIVRGRELRRDLRPGRHPRPRRQRPRLLRGARRRSTPAGIRCPGGSRTTSRCRSSTCTSPCTRR